MTTRPTSAALPTLLLPLLPALVLALILAFPCSPALAAGAGSPSRAALLEGYAARIRAVLAQGQTPIIDVEHHWGGKLSLERLVSKMNTAGVALTWLGQNERNGSGHALQDAASFPDLMVPTTIHGDGPRWHGHDASLLTELEADAKSGLYFAMGEFEGRHYISSTNNRDVHLPVDSPHFEQVFRIAAQTGLPMLIHHEAEDALLPELERMLDKYPGAKVIWCHAGRNRDRGTWTIASTPEGMRALLERHPNLFLDLNQSPPGSKHRGTRQVDSVLYDIDPDKGGNQPDAKLNEGWKALMEEHPARFVFGTDVNTGRWDNYEGVVERFRWIVLRALSPETAAAIAYRNAWRLMSGQEWKP